jgi:hypothetical protein
VVDLRDGGPLPQVADLVVVIDDSADLPRHGAEFEQLDRDARHLLCVAVGEQDGLDRGDGVLLAVPEVLRHVKCPILWVADEQGVLWSPSVDNPIPLQLGTSSGLDELVDVLRLPEVFLAVRRALEDVPDHTASPGTVVVSGGVDPDTLRQARSMAVQRLTRFRSDMPVPEPLARPTSFPRHDDLPDPNYNDPMSKRRLLVEDAIGAAAETVDELPQWSSLFRRSDDTPYSADRKNVRGRPGQKLRRQLDHAVTLVNRYQHHVAEVTRDIDGSLRVGRPSPDQIVRTGVRTPDGVNGTDIARAVGGVVAEAVAKGYALSTLAAYLKQAAALAAPQGCAAEADELAQLDDVERTLPKFRALPLWGWTSPIVALACLVVPVLPIPLWAGRIIATMIALLWFGAGWFLLSRRPNDDEFGGDMGLTDAAKIAWYAYLLPGVLGTAAGIWLADRLRAVVPRSFWAEPWQGWVTVGVVVAVLVTLVITSWPSAAKAWVKAARVRALRSAFTEARRVADRAVQVEWIPSARRRAVALAFNEAAAALGEVGDRLAATTSDRIETGLRGQARAGGMAGPLLDELLDVLRGDLTDLVRRSVDPAWEAIGGLRRNASGLYARRATVLLDEYEEHITRYGLLTVPSPGVSPEPRKRLLLQNWTDSPDAEQALRAGVGDDMRQLCRKAHLYWLDKQALDRHGGTRLVRFAPQPVKQVLEANSASYKGILADQPIWTTTGDIVGALRLVPLRTGAIAEAPRG